MRALRTLTTWLVFAAAAGVSAVAIVNSARRPLPAMARADLGQVWRWIESIELATAPREQLDSLLDRALADVGAFAREAPEDRGSPDQAQRVQRNLLLLAQHWARRAIGQYAELPPDQREAFVDRRATDIVALLPLVSGRAWNHDGQRGQWAMLLRGDRFRKQSPWDIVAASAAGYQVSEEFIATLPRAQHAAAREFRTALTLRLSRRLKDLSPDQR